MSNLFYPLHPALRVVAIEDQALPTIGQVIVNLIGLDSRGIYDGATEGRARKATRAGVGEGIARRRNLDDRSSI